MTAQVTCQDAAWVEPDSGYTCPRYSSEWLASGVYSHPMIAYRREAGRVHYRGGNRLFVMPWEVSAIMLNQDPDQ